MALLVSKAQARPSVSFSACGSGLLDAGLNYFSSTFLLVLHAFCHDDNGLTKPVSKSPIWCFFIARTMSKIKIIL